MAYLGWRWHIRAQPALNGVARLSPKVALEELLAKHRANISPESVLVVQARLAPPLPQARPRKGEHGKRARRGAHPEWPPPPRCQSRPHEINLGVWRGKSSGFGGVQSCFEDLRALTGGSRPPILRLHPDKASEFLTPTIRAYLSQQGVRQTVKSGCDPQGNGLAERWIGIVKVRATALLADVRLSPDYWSYACRWVAYVHTHRVTEIPINKFLPHFGDVVVVRQAFKKPPSFENRGVAGVCLGHGSRIAGGALVSAVNGELKEVCSAKIRLFQGSLCQS